MEEKSIESNLLYNHLRQLCYLRVVAILGQILVVTLVHYHLEIPLPIMPMFSITGALTVFNLFAWYRTKRRQALTEAEIFLHLAVDIIAFTGQLYYSGGASNPFVSLFLLQVIIAATVLRPVYTWLIVVLTACCYLLVSFLYKEIPHFLHYHLGQFFNLHVHGMFMSFALSAILTTYFITRLTGNVKVRDRQLHAIREQAKAEEHIIKLGMMATGAAHELGTPLSTIAVITREMQHEAEDYPQFAKPLALLSSQVERCKTSLSQILESTQHIRAEEAYILPLNHYIETLVKRWKEGTILPHIRYAGNLPDRPVVAEKIIEQAIVNVLDNAAEAAKERIDITTHEEQGEVKITITDDGHGIACNHRIKPHHSSKTSGYGLGLFLSQTVVQRLGGRLEIKPGISGTSAVISIPMEALCA